MKIVGGVNEHDISFWLCYSIVHHHYILESYLLCSVLCGMYAGIFSAYIASLFSVSVKFSGIAVSYNTGFVVFGGLSPVVMTYLIHEYNNLYTAAIAMVVAAIIAIIGLCFSKPLRRLFIVGMLLTTDCLAVTFAIFLS